MIDREKVIDILGACGTDDCDNCPLNGDERCSGFIDVPSEVLMDAIALLKEQEEGIAPKPTDEKTAQTAKRIGIFCPDYWCGNCEYQLIEHSRFCPNCGKKVKWNE